MADQFGGVPIDEPQTDQFGGVPVAEQPTARPSILDFVPGGSQSKVTEIAKAFGRGAAEPWQDSLGLGPESTKWLADAGIFAKGEKYENPFHAMNELVANAAVGAGQIVYRAGASLFGGYQAAVQEAGEQVGLPRAGRELAAMPEAFFGSPHFHGVSEAVPPKPFVRETPIKPIEGQQAMPRSQAALTGDPTIDAVIQHPTVRHVVDNAVVDRQHTIPYEAGGSLPLENPTTYVDRNVPQTFTTRRLSDPEQTVTFDTGEPMAIHENVEEFVMQELIKKGWEAPDAYRVAHFGWAEPAEQAWYRANDIDPAAAEAEWKKLQPGIQHEIADETPSDLYHKEYPGQDVTKARHEQLFEAEPTAEELARARSDMDEVMSRQPAGTVDLDQARSLGVIGDERSRIDDGNPEQAARRAMAADQRQDKLSGDPPQLNRWEKDFDQFVGKLNASEDVKQLIRETTRKNGNFPAARQGNIPLYQVDEVARASGFHPSELNPRGLGRLLRNDDEVQSAIRAMLQAGDNVAQASRNLLAEDTPENLMKMQQAMLQRDLVVEATLRDSVELVVGMRAEWGRTGNAIQKFMKDVTDIQTLGDFMKDRETGPRTPDDLRDIAKQLQSLPRSGQARFLKDARKPDFWDHAMWYWTNALISGWVTHSKYVLANFMFGAVEHGLTIPVAGVVGTARRALTGSAEGVRLHEAPYALYGYLAGVPEALRAAVEAARTGMQTPLPSETALGIIPKKNTNVFFQQAAIPGKVGTVLGVPSRGAAAIHSFFNFLGHRASIEASAARTAASEGMSNFIARQHELAISPTEPMMREGIEDGYRLTFIDDLGPKAKKLNLLLNEMKISVPGIGKVPVGRMVLPFTHIPFKLLARTTEYVPEFALLREDVRADLAGKNGAVKQDKAIARMALGSAVGAYATYLVMNDGLTGYGPTDPKERQTWLINHQPYSIKIGGSWLSLQRFGPIGSMLGIHANLAEIIPHLQPDSDELKKAVALIVHDTGRLMEDETGMQGVDGLFQLINDPERSNWPAQFAGSWMPFSSALRQTASAIDPYMRQSKTFIDGLRYQIPGLRQSLLPKRDYAGRAQPNPAYGGDLPVPGASSLIQHRAVTSDPVDLEMATLGIRPGAPINRVGGLQLPPELYDRYAAMAGSMAHTTLEGLTSQPGWFEIPVGIRHDIFQKAIERAHKGAAAMLMASRPDIIQAGVQNRQNRINGVKPIKLTQ